MQTPRQQCNRRRRGMKSQHAQQQCIHESNAIPTDTGRASPLLLVRATILQVPVPLQELTKPLRLIRGSGNMHDWLSGNTSEYTIRSFTQSARNNFFKHLLFLRLKGCCGRTPVLFSKAKTLSICFSVRDAKLEYPWNRQRGILLVERVVHLNYRRKWCSVFYKSIHGCNLWT